MAVEVIQALEVIELIRRNRCIQIPASHAVTGATAGWTKGNDKNLLLLPASKAASTATIPIKLESGTFINGFSLSGQIDSAGNVATLDADLRRTTATIGGITDESLGAITQISKTADYLITDEKEITPTKVECGKGYYILLTGTTSAVTDIELNTISVNVDKR